MKKLFLGIIVSALTVYSLSSLHSKGKIKVLPIVQVKQIFKSELQSFMGQLQDLKTLIGKKADPIEVRNQFLKSRIPFKQIEAFLYYMDPEQFNTYINGAPLPKIMKKVPSLMIIEPAGMQVLEELIYEDELEYEVLTVKIDQLIQELNTISPSHIDQQLTDPIVFEALRFGILRMNILGVTGFDSPGNTDKALNEVRYNLTGVSKMIAPYASYISKEDKLQLAKIVKQAQSDLKNTNFEEFDRVKFHKECADPMWRLLLKLQMQLHIELPNQRMDEPWAINYMAESLYADDFLSVEYFAEYFDKDKEKARVELGSLLFFDPILSQNQTMACASCHQPDKGFADGLKTAQQLDGTSFGLRNTPTILNAVFAEKYFYDLRVDRLSAQMDHVIFNPNEFDSDYKQIIENLKLSPEYRSLFEASYGKEGITRNTVTNAITRYVSSLHSYNSSFDKYMRGETKTIDPAVIRGYNLFAGKATCATCHFAPTFSGLVPPNFMESESEVLGVPKAFVAPYVLDEDKGRFVNGLITEKAPFYERSFKTTTLRNIELTAPYMHNGAFTTLEEVLEFYNKGGGEGLGMDVPYQTLPADELNLTPAEIQDIISFLRALTDTTSLNNSPKILPSFPSKTDWNARKVGGIY